MKKLLKFIVIAILIFIAIGYFIGNKVLTTVYTFESEKIDQELRIVQITDVEDNFEDFDEVLYMVTSLNPDYIILSGDVFLNQENYELTMNFISNLKKIAEVIYVRGHTDSEGNDYGNLRFELENNGIIVLQDNYLDVGNIRFIGINDDNLVTFLSPNNSRAEHVEKTLSRLIDPTKYNVVISHRPQYFDEYVDATSDLVLTGHTNGGVVRLPFINKGLLASDQGFFPKYSYGIYEKDSSVMIISAGLSEDSFLPRLYNAKEIILIQLK